MYRRWRIFASVVVLLVSGCASVVADPDDNVVTMTIAAPTVTDFDDYVAKAKGFYDARGVTVRRVQTGTAAQSVQLLATGEAEIGRGLANAIQARVRTSGQLDFVNVADPTVRPPYVMTSKGIRDFAALTGTSLGITSVTDQGTIVTMQMLQRRGVDPDGVQLLPTGGTASRLAAMNAGGIASTLLLPPVSFTAEQQGAVRMGYLPELLGEGYQFSFTGIVVRESWAKANRDRLVRYLAARDDALRWLNDPANAAEATAILARETKISPEKARQTYELLFRSTVDAFAPRIGVSLPAGEGVLSGLRLAGLLHDKDSRIEEFVDDSYAAGAREVTG
ncbi:ABC transporter substrate-binding protein [Amycolatopsis suaedae]|uniref:ABC transporter substrate-binding protein n=1 Tax=Amycolatopsis suaedae TaxID=2510978 RepID=A0A4Q7J238_9PSEU|nr:ABC transporter substrate-binding protein [Amycolatopsis suaedae]RZQ60808.1 ABC transporter substrate-binding protein [Amycolatopsis suaedae]